MRKKLVTLVGILLLILLGAGIFVASYFNNQWSQAKASYLARRALLDPTAEDIQKLSQEKSVRAAVDALFAPPSQQDEQAYQQGLANLQSKKSTYKSDIQFNNVEYTYEMIHDPDRAHRMLYYLFENIFSVDGSEKDDGILYSDVQNLDKMLYADSYGNYLQMVEDVRNNYAMARYLDLVNSPKKDPNENFARELMQLFLIGPYTPLDHSQSTLNYSDADVNALAYILTGYKINKQDRTIYFDPRDHYDGQEQFLGSEYNDPIHVISYIESKKKQEMAEFLANKLLHYYVSDNPSDSNITSVAKMVLANNFEILPTVKQLLASDIMYSPTHMQEERFKSPPQLVASFYAALYGRSDYGAIPSGTILEDLDFQPYRPGSIFGRDGFNNNALFYSGTIVNKWIGDTENLLSQQHNAVQVLEQQLQSSSAEEVVTTLSKLLNYSMNLPASTQQQLLTYLTSRRAVGSRAVSSQLTGLLGIMFAQPEFLAVSGNMQNASLPVATNIQDNSSDPLLVVVRIKGGYDYQQLVANVSDPAYAANRKQMALNSLNSTSLGSGYVLNNAAVSLVPLIKNKQVFFISGVGLPDHSRAHDVASKQMETGLLSNGNGILSQLAFDHQSTKLISFTNTPPIMLKGQPSLQIGSANLSLFPRKNEQAEATVLKNIFSSRQFPSSIATYYSQALLLDNLAKENIALGGKGTPGNTNATQLPFLESLVNQHVGNTYYLYADDSYDTHVQEDEKFDKQIKGLFDTLTRFYNDEKDKRKLAIVVFSEFGRTDKINGGNGTDHGTGGGMVILSNALLWPEMVGSLAPSKDAHNWSDVKVDERDMWATLFHDLYGLQQNTLFGRSQTIDNYPITIK